MKLVLTKSDLQVESSYADKAFDDLMPIVVEEHIMSYCHFARGTR